MKAVNGTTAWIETHFEVVRFITQNEDSFPTIQNILEEKGTGGLYELSEDLTDEFETSYEGKEWDGEFFDEIEEFLLNKLGN